MNRIRDLLITVGSFALMSILFQVWFRDWYLVAILMTALSLHELGHIVALAKYGYRTKLVFIPFVGAATIPIDQERFKTIKWFKSAVTYLSGPLVNFMIVIISAGIYLLPNPEVKRYALISMGINASLGVFNLWPIGSLDGGGFAKNLFESLPESRERSFIKAIRIAIILGVLALVLFGKIPAIFSVIVPIWTIGLAANKDNQYNSFSHLAMNTGQAWIITIWYIVMMVGLIIVNTLIPNWIGLTNIAIWPFFVILGIVVAVQLLIAFLTRHSTASPS